jgi:hypothetical protein
MARRRQPLLPGIETQGRFWDLKIFSEGIYKNAIADDTPLSVTRTDPHVGGSQAWNGR